MIKENIKNLLDLDISSYEISRKTGVTRQLIDKYRKEPETVGKLTLDNALALNQYWEELNMSLEEKILKALSVMDEEIRYCLYDVYLESNGNLWFVDSGMAYNGDDKSAKEVAQVEDGEIINLY